MDFKQLQSFISVVRCKSFTEAAEELGISQPTISTHIRILEEELNSRLIVRTAKSFEVTPRGTELFECAQNILKLRDDMINRWNGHDSKVIRLGVSTIPSAYILPEILPTFGKSHEDIYFVVTQSDSRGIIDAVHKGSYELGLVGMKTDDEQLVFRKFYQDRLVMIAPVNDYFLEMKDTGSFSLEEVLQEQPVILREQGSGTGKSASAFLEKIGFPKISSTLQPASMTRKPSKTSLPAASASPSSPRKPSMTISMPNGCCSSNCPDISPAGNSTSFTIRSTF